jgi:glycosyltransferase involved in cell wall biosynthesis
MKNKDLAIFGPYPPPLGGISVHIKRLEYYLKRAEIDYTVYNHGFTQEENIIATRKKPIWYLKLLFLKKYKAFHFHQFFYFHFIYYWLFSLLRSENIIVTIHSERLLNYSGLKLKIALFFLSKTKRLTLISVSKNLKGFLDSNGISTIFLPAYVPPNLINEKTVVSHKQIFLFSVWKFNKKLATEIYNVPLAFTFLKKNKAKFKMLFLIGNELDSDKEFLRNMIDDYSIENDLEVIYNENLIDYVKQCKFLLRPNLSDGYGVSIQEAMDLGVPAVASDVCERPVGAVLFKDNDLEDLSKKVEYVLNTPKTEILKQKEELTYHETLMVIYLENLKELK